MDERVDGTHLHPLDEPGSDALLLLGLLLMLARRNTGEHEHAGEMSEQEP